MDKDLKVNIDLQLFAEIRNKCISIIQNMILAGDGEFNLIDSYFIGSVDKSCFLIDGMISAIKNMNSTVVGILLRTQMDNCQRAFAITLVEDPHQFIKNILEGSKISDLTDRNNKKMKDCYLKEKLGELDSRFKQVYDKACNYIHFSIVGMLHTMNVSNAGKNTISFSIGKIRKEDIPVIEEGSLAFLHYTNLLCQIVESWARRKRDILQ